MRRSHASGERSADERVDLRRRRRQAEQIEIGAADERVAIGARRRLSARARGARLRETDRSGW